MSINLHAPTRRELLFASGVMFAWAHMPKLARAEGRDPRLLVIVLRGALDGLAAVPPVADPDWVRLRGDSALRLDGPNPALPLDNTFALNPAMPNLHQLYKNGEAIILHAVSTPYRERSHFDGQDVLESGLPKPGAVDSGWLNRALSSMVPGDNVRRSLSGLAVGPLAPLVVRGSAPIMSWTPRRPANNEDTVMRLLELYRHTDPSLAKVLEERLGLAAIAGAGTGPGATNPRDKDIGAAARVRAFFAQSAGSAAKFMARADGPRVGALSFDGWDTHANQGPVNGRLALLLGALDGAIAAVKTESGEAWKETVVTIITEFGRTARVNGTEGTDHGTGTIALLAGGALKGGRVISDWPGLADHMLYEQRDLKPTQDLRGALKGLLKDHLRVPDAALEATIFPGSADVRPLQGLVG